MSIAVATRAASTSSDFLSTLDRSLEAPRRRFLHSRLLRHVMAGTMSRELYAALLRETWHFVRHTPGHLRLAAARLGDDAMKAIFLHHAEEETGHDMWALADLEELGVDPEEVRQSVPLPHTTALVAYQHYTVTRLHPKALLGLEYAMEGLTAQAGGSAVERLKTSLSLPDRALRFFSGHAELDCTHAQDDADVIRRHIITPEEQRAVLRNARDSVVLYTSLYDGICDHLGV